MSLRYGTIIVWVLILSLILALKNEEAWIHAADRETEKKAMGKPRDKPGVHSNSEKENTLVSSNSSAPIAEKNIFTPERKEFPAIPAERTKPIARTQRPHIILYGIAIAPDYQSASVINPGMALNENERETKTIKVGDRVGGYTLVKIFPDRITMEGPGDSFDVLLYNSNVPKKRVEITTADANTGQPSSEIATGEKNPKPEPQMTLEKTKEPLPERHASYQPILFRGGQFPNRELARQSRSALMNKRNASPK